MSGNYQIVTILGDDEPLSLLVDSNLIVVQIPTGSLANEHLRVDDRLTEINEYRIANDVGFQRLYRYFMARTNNISVILQSGTVSLFYFVDYLIINVYSQNDRVVKH
jgi:hypothetical protein